MLAYIEFNKRNAIAAGRDQRRQELRDAGDSGWDADADA